MVSPRQLAELIGVHRRTIHRWRDWQFLPPADLIIGTTIRWKKDTIAQWMAEHRG